MERTHPGRQILIVEDEPDTADSLALLLRRRGHRVEVARTGSEGLQVALATRPEIIILDIGLPGMDGYDVAARLRASGGLDEVVIIAYTGYVTGSDRARSVAAGIDYHFAKPTGLRDILALLDVRGLRGTWALSRLCSPSVTESVIPFWGSRHAI